MKKRVIALLMIFLLLFSATVYAAEEEEELVNVEEIVEEIEQASSTSVDTPNINSRAAIVIERNSQIPIYEKNSNERRKMASTTKIMTAIIVVEKGNLEETVTVSKKAGGTGGSRLGLKAGDKVKVKDMLYGLMLCSGNDAAVALAEHIGGSDRISQDATTILSIVQKEPGVEIRVMKSRDSKIGDKLTYHWDIDKGLLTFIPTATDATNGKYVDEVKKQYEKEGVDVF